MATGVAADGHREVLGFDVGDSEDGAFWTAFLRSLRTRGLAGVQLVISDAHAGLKNAIAAVLPVNSRRMAVAITTTRQPSVPGFLFPALLANAAIIGRPDHSREALGARRSCRRSGSSCSS